MHSFYDLICGYVLHACFVTVAPGHVVQELEQLASFVVGKVVVI